MKQTTMSLLLRDGVQRIRDGVQRIKSGGKIQSVGNAYG